MRAGTKARDRGQRRQLSARTLRLDVGNGGPPKRTTATEELSSRHHPRARAKQLGDGKRRRRVAEDVAIALVLLAFDEQVVPRLHCRPATAGDASLRLIDGPVVLTRVRMPTAALGESREDRLIKTAKLSRRPQRRRYAVGRRVRVAPRCLRVPSRRPVSDELLRVIATRARNRPAEWKGGRERCPRLRQPAFWRCMWSPAPKIGACRRMGLCAAQCWRLRVAITLTSRGNYVQFEQSEQTLWASSGCQLCNSRCIEITISQAIVVPNEF